MTRVSLVYPLAGILEPPKEVDSRLVVCAVSKSIYRGRVTDPRVTLFGYDNTLVEEKFVRGAAGLSIWSVLYHLYSESKEKEPHYKHPIGTCSGVTPRRARVRAALGRRAFVFSSSEGRVTLYAVCIAPE